MRKKDGKFEALDSIGPRISDDERNQTQNASYVEDLLSRLEKELPGIFDHEMVSAGAQKRKLNSPEEETKDGSVRGEWDDSTFHLDDSFIPINFNPERHTIAQIRKELSDKYGIRLSGISYSDGIADFSSISVADVSTKDIVMETNGISEEDYKNLSQNDRAELFQRVFYKTEDGKRMRQTNFDSADRIAAERQIPIRGLPEKYTADQLEEWRIHNRFTWDEQISGYHLVPSVIHGNLSHTGLVGTAKGAHSFLEQRKEDLKHNPDKYCWDEDYAPISFEDVYSHKASSKGLRKGEKNMAMRRVLSKGMNLGRHSELGYDEIREKTDKGFEENERLKELGENLVKDKEKLEAEIEKVQASSIDADAKARMIATLNMAIDRVQTQYELDVAAEMERVQQEIEEQTDLMEQAVNELSEQADSLRGVTMDAAATDASEAADEADAKKEAFEQMKDLAGEKLRMKMEEAERQQREIRARRLSGR